MEKNGKKGTSRKKTSKPRKAIDKKARSPVPPPLGPAPATLRGQNSPFAEGFMQSMTRLEAKIEANERRERERAREQMEFRQLFSDAGFGKHAKFGIAFSEETAPRKKNKK